MTALVLWVYAAMCLLAPVAGMNVHLALAIGSAVEDAPAVFARDVDKRRTASTMVAIAYRETGGTFDEKVIGDHGTSFCAFQIHVSAGGTKALTEDASLCARTGLRILRESVRACPEHPIAYYARGPKGCTSETAQAISRDRMSLAQWLAGHVSAEASVL